VAGALQKTKGIFPKALMPKGQVNMGLLLAFEGKRNLGVAKISVKRTMKIMVNQSF